MIAIAVGDELEIRQPRSRVYAFVSDHAHLPAWMAGISRTSRLTPGPIGVGTRYRVVGRMLGRRVESTYEVTAYEPDTMFSGRLTSHLFTMEETYRFEGDDATTRVILEAEASPGGRLALLSPLLAVAVPRQVKADHQRLKRVLEARPRKAARAAKATAKATATAKPAPPPAPETDDEVDEAATEG